MKKITIALTGGIGAGKSTVAQMFAEYGAEVVSGDELGRRVLCEDTDVRRALTEKLGNDVYNKTGEPNRRLIASRVFAESALAAWLTSLTFPGIYSRWRKCREQSDATVIVFDAALIFEWNIQSEFDVVISVLADEKVAFTRSSGRFSSDDFHRRRASQIADEDKLRAADIVVYNDGTLAQLQEQTKHIWQTHILPLTA